MKLTIERDELLRALGRVQAIVERRGTMPILANVLIEAREDGLTLAATDLEVAVIANAFGPSPNRAFTTEGTFVDGAGDVLNGTLFLGEPGDQHSARAVTIFGPTGLLRVWRWNGRQWIE